jgi:hypothetical protein
VRLRRRGMWMVASLIVGLTSILVAACGLIGGGIQAGPPCADVFPADRCAAMLSRAAEMLGVTDTEISSIDVAPAPTDGDGLLIKHSGGFLAVNAHIGSTVRQVAICIGVDHGPACGGDLALTINSPTDGG